MDYFFLGCFIYLGISAGQGLFGFFDISSKNQFANFFAGFFVVISNHAVSLTSNCVLFGFLDC